jgi:trehalose 6-phosphate phosphatase
VYTLDTVPVVWDREDELYERLDAKQLVIFLDYDGTLTPIVEDYRHAILADAMRATLARLAQCYTVSVISGRDLQDLRHLVQLDGLFYAGSHGFDIAGPQGWRERLQQGTQFLPDLDRAESTLLHALVGIQGHAIERKAFTIAVHYRQVPTDQAECVEHAVDQVLERHLPRLRKRMGKKVFEVQPNIDWDKGQAVCWLLDRLGLATSGVLPLYIGDDVTDEDAFRVLHERGIGIVIRDGIRTTAAQYALSGPSDVQRFLEILISRADGGGG